MSSFNRPPQYQNSPRMGAPRSQSMQEKSQAMETEDEERAAMSKWQATPKKSVAFAVNEGVGDMFDGRAARADMEVCEQSLQRIVQKNPLCRELISSFNKSPPTNLKLSDNKFNLSGASLMKT